MIRKDVLKKRKALKNKIYNNILWVRQWISKRNSVGASNSIRFESSNIKIHHHNIITL